MTFGFRAHKHVLNYFAFHYFDYERTYAFLEKRPLQ